MPPSLDSDRLRELDHELLSRASRRRFVRLLVGAGFGAGAARLLTPEDFLAADADEVPIVYGLARSPDDPWAVRALTKAVPEAWLDAVRRAVAIKEELAEVGVPGFAGAFVVPGDYRDTTASLHVDVLHEEGTSIVKEVVSDVEYAIRVVDPPGPPWGEEARTDGGPTGETDRTPRVDEVDDGAVPGGVLCETDELAGTIAPALFDPGRRRRWFATANHVYGEEGSLRSAHRGNPLFLARPEGATRIGRVGLGYPEADVVRVDPVEGYRPTPRIDGASPSRVAGQFTQLGLADLYARGEELEKIGAVSGHTSGPIEGVNGITCYYGSICKTGQLRWGSSETMTDGDSGSVSYHPDPARPDDRLLVAGVNNARTWWPGGDFTWGTAAHHLRERYGLHF